MCLRLGVFFFFQAEHAFRFSPCSRGLGNFYKYDLEFSPAGARQWDGKKYWSKINNLARAITNFTTQTTPSGPAFIGVSEIENRSVLEDLVKAVDNRLISEGKRPWGLRVVHHDSPDRRGVDVGALYNPRYFKLALRHI